MRRQKTQTRFRKTQKNIVKNTKNSTWLKLTQPGAVFMDSMKIQII